MWYREVETEMIMLKLVHPKICMVYVIIVNMSLILKCYNYNIYPLTAYYVKGNGNDISTTTSFNRK